MKNTMILAATLAAAAAMPAAHASADLAKAKACMACHTVASKLVGPSYKDVATKYAKDAGAEARLALKIQKGSSGTWGPIPMPANPQVSDAEAQTLAKWILAQK
ncbi:c-type cytochrome [Massilia sp. CFBP9012]|uniref:c-type cytochrome n=1 Tax=Massilia sp. CFBP9012 TaxID=3096531 RepID=UPI002A6A749B|nr:c-type cytochrome [Massilia sp. CFBP9012]MDY0975517.1 c-type cytochrome [Massilia sp. CFBP9012]